jgi:hypothetical protein
VFDQDKSIAVDEPAWKKATFTVALFVYASLCCKHILYVAARRLKAEEAVSR